MPKIFDLEKKQPIAEIGAEELQSLRSKLGGGHRGIAEFTVTRESLEALKPADPAAGEKLYQTLNAALGSGAKLDIGVADSDAGKSFTVRGKILDKGRPCACVKVEAYDEHPVADALLGCAFTDADGGFALGFDGRNYRGDNALLVMISRWENGESKELLRLKPKIENNRELSLGDVEIAD